MESGLAVEIAETRDQPLVHERLLQNEVVTSDGEPGESHASAVDQAFANAFVYQTPVRSSRNHLFSGTAITLATPIAQQNSDPRGRILARQVPAAPNSDSPSVRMTHLGRATTSTLSGFPSLPSPSSYSLPLPYHDVTRRSTVSARGRTDPRRDERSALNARRRSGENAENEPIEQDFDDVPTGISSPSARPHPGQLDEALQQWQR